MSQVVLGDVLIHHKPLVCTSGSCWTQFRSRGRLSYYGVNLKESRSHCFSSSYICETSDMLTSDGPFFTKFESLRVKSSELILSVNMSCFNLYIIAEKKDLKA